MYWRPMCLLLLSSCLLKAVIIDRIAIAVGNSIVKDSDIRRDIRVTDFLNSQAVSLEESVRRAAANRLIDQIFIRREIEIGDYPMATPRQANEELDHLVNERFKTEIALENSLKHYELTPADLRSHFQWQLTVLSFIDARFKPAVLVSDADVAKYYSAHKGALQRQYPGKNSANELRPQITNLLAAERVDKLFFAWLDEQRKQAKFTYFEADLR